jgi:DNA-binding CsgD family transcriptional regulator
MASYDSADVEEVASLISWAADPTMQLALHERKRRLGDRLAALIDADVWLWSSTIPNHDAPGDFMTACMIEGGWKDEEERAIVYQAITSPALGRDVLGPLYDYIQSGQRHTWICRELFGPKKWPEVAATWNLTGFNDFIMSVFPVSRDFSSNTGFHRRLGRPEYTSRERDLVHLVMGSIPWLHLHASNTKAADTVTRLTPRERQVLILLLGGDAQKTVAEKLKISEHTVGDYMKQLNKRFRVSSRAELQARFYVGDLNDAFGEPS